MHQVTSAPLLSETMKMLGTDSDITLKQTKKQILHDWNDTSMLDTESHIILKIAI